MDSLHPRSPDGTRSGPGARGAASAALRLEVDAAVGAGYDAPFARLDLLLVTSAALCGCPVCDLTALRERDRIVATLPAA